LMFGYAVNRPDQDAPKILELVAGEGDSYAAREAPALGMEGGVKLTMPTPTPAKPVPLPPVEPAAVPPPPPAVAPAPKAATTPANDAVPNFKKKLMYEVVRGDAKAKYQLRKEREAEKKRQAEEAKRLTKEEFDRAQKNKSTGSTPPTKVPRIDGEGIAKGVVGGSVNNKVGGAGGKALRTDNDDVLGAYYAMFKQRMRAEFEAPPGLSDSLQAKVSVRSNPDGTLTNARITRPSGSRVFDQAALEAIKRVKMPPRPDGKAEPFEFDFTMRAPD
jgi:colicin import membrane protein